MLSQPWRRPEPHSTASTTRSSVRAAFTLSHDDPRLPAAYGRVARLGHHAFVPLRQRAARETRAASSGRRRHDVRDHQRRRDQRRQRVEALALRPVEQVVAVGVQHVEEERCQRQLRAQRVDVEPPPEAAHRVLERARRAIGLEREHLAVEDQLTAPASPARPRRLRARPVSRDAARARTPRTSSPALCTWMRAPSSLYSSAASPSDRQRLARRRRRRRRASAAPAAERGGRSASSAAAPPARSAAGDRRQVAGQHRRAPHARGRHACRARDGLDEHAFERALAQLAEEQPDEKVLLVDPWRGSRAVCSRSTRRRVLPGPEDAATSANTPSTSASVSEASIRRRHVPCFTNRRAADSDATLWSCAGQIRNRDPQLVGRDLCKKRREVVDLTQPAGGPRHRAG